jgi:hypothetical protein
MKYIVRVSWENGKSTKISFSDKNCFPTNPVPSHPTIPFRVILFFRQKMKKWKNEKMKKCISVLKVFVRPINASDKTKSKEFLFIFTFGKFEIYLINDCNCKLKWKFEKIFFIQNDFTTRQLFACGELKAF